MAEKEGLHLEAEDALPIQTSGAGFQMLGQDIDDPHIIEGTPGSSAGLGWLDIQATIEAQKQLRT